MSLVDGKTTSEWHDESQRDKFSDYLRSSAPAPSAPASKKVSGGQTARGAKRRRVAARGKFKSGVAERAKARRRRG